VFAKERLKNSATNPRREMSHKWVDNVLVCGDGTMITQLGSVLEIRGDQWEGRKRKGDTPLTDRPRVCRLGSDDQARNVAELIDDLISPNTTIEARRDAVASDECSGSAE
jgi:hypothetical protein